jgi:hypothetical protein
MDGGGLPRRVASPAASVELASSSAVTQQPSPFTNDVVGEFRTAVRWVAQRVKSVVVRIASEQVAVNQFNRPFSTPAGVGPCQRLSSDDIEALALVC